MFSYSLRVVTLVKLYRFNSYSYELRIIGILS